MIDEGYIKYECLWTRTPALNNPVTRVIDKWRRPLFDAGLIGQCEDTGIGFGNISVRSESSRQFIITGTQTGHLENLDGRHFAQVTDYDIRKNQLSCEGAIQASSESLTHAAIYELDPAVHAIVHVHSDSLWHKHRDAIPTTNAAVAYGTPEMAEEFGRLYRETDFARTGIAVMGGHDGGLISIGHHLAAAVENLAKVGPTPPIRLPPA
jgi:ribulose-5-phosphate 4-epimerase/fuculose-1-phosphate aldolase